MNNFDLRTFLIENRLTTNSKQLPQQEVDEVNWKGLAAGTAMALGTLSAQGQEAPKADQPLTWQQMTQPQKAAKKAELIKRGGFQRFAQYKDSISSDATSRREADFAKSAAIKGMTVDQYIKYLKQNAKKEPVGLDGLNTARDLNRAEKCNAVDGPSFLSKLNPFKEKTGCIYSDEDKSGVKK